MRVGFRFLPVVLAHATILLAATANATIQPNYDNSQIVPREPIYDSGYGGSLYIIDIPSVSFEYKGVRYCIDEEKLAIRARWEDLGANATACYNRDKPLAEDGLPLITLNSRMTRWRELMNKVDYLLSKLPTAERVELYSRMDDVRHEAIHFLVDKKYHGDVRSKEYHFLQEMMAHIGGQHMSEIEAANIIAERYPALKSLATEYLVGKANSVLDKMKKGDGGLETDIAQSNQYDHHTLDLDNPNGDWCKCKEPGCRADMDVDKGYVMFGCSVCGKVNVKYAKMALELEQRMNEAGKEGHWYGPNAEDNAHKAAGKR